jgi:hypothetical protein
VNTSIYRPCSRRAQGSCRLLVGQGQVPRSGARRAPGAPWAAEAMRQQVCRADEATTSFNGLRILSERCRAWTGHPQALALKSGNFIGVTSCLVVERQLARLKKLVRGTYQFPAKSGLVPVFTTPIEAALCRQPEDLGVIDLALPRPRHFPAHYPQDCRIFLQLVMMDSPDVVESSLCPASIGSHKRVRDGTGIGRPEIRLLRCFVPRGERLPVSGVELVGRSGGMMLTDAKVVWIFSPPCC